MGCVADSQLVTIDALPEVRRDARSLELIVTHGGALVHTERYTIPHDGEFPFLFALSHANEEQLSVRVYAEDGEEPIARGSLRLSVGDDAPPRMVLVPDHWERGDDV